MIDRDLHGVEFKRSGSAVTFTFYEMRSITFLARRMTIVFRSFAGCMEENIEERLSLYHPPRAHHKHLKSTNLLERVNEEITRWTRVVRIFPNAASCLRLVRVLTTEIY